MITILIGLLLNALLVFIVAKLTPGINVKHYGAAIAVAFTYAALSWLFKGILVFLAFPLILVTFGLFHLVLNAFLLWVTDKILDSFEITSMKALAIGTVALTIGGAGVTLLVGH
ncbi:MAG TPA: phage holin family protein [Nitrospirales bacterium]|nr:phage holin family protein [Nitrospirales bacterium]HIB53551.1 phage holin family protein [Nitrospirales bacterium]HIC04149.1 phage holin family protein [Nitrospirales bacterium]HIN33479.1 phage holin family protein [Nitrospirales bacterium]HIO21043.1 phage holin family protein [Nitrospirales bacterium]